MPGLQARLQALRDTRLDCPPLTTRSWDESPHALPVLTQPGVFSYCGLIGGNVDAIHLAIADVGLNPLDLRTGTLDHGRMLA